jgi:hypothetical protein
MRPRFKRFDKNSTLLLPSLHNSPRLNHGNYPIFFRHAIEAQQLDPSGMRIEPTGEG